MIHIDINGLLGTDLGTSPATPASLINDCTFTFQSDGLGKTNIMGTRAAADAIRIYAQGHAGHGRYLISDLGGDIRQYAPQTATRAAVANSEQFMAGADVKPDGIKLVAPDHMYQTCLTALLHMCQSLTCTDRPTQLGINSLGRLAEK